jgi:FtsP/CotA-like multicopper oxidase with cupredoxin domain
VLAIAVFGWLMASVFEPRLQQALAATHLPVELADAVWQQRDKLAALVAPAGASAEAAAAINGAVHAAFVAGYRWIMAATIWGYDRMFPGPTFVERYGVASVVRIRNNLLKDAQGPGSPQISTHLHNLHCASASDGYPADFYPRSIGPTGVFRDHHYPNCLAGCDDARYQATHGDTRESLGTLWYHDHCLYFTAQNVYRGLAGFYLLFDALDNGDETNPAGLRLPSGVGRYDIPLLFNDPRIDSSGYVQFDQFENDGHLGNVFCVNGKAYPYFPVERRKYRLRLLNASITRFYEFYLCTSTGANQPFDYIANDGNLLPAPLRNQRSVALAPAERADIVVDFSGWPAGTKLFW